MLDRMDMRTFVMRVEIASGCDPHAGRHRKITTGRDICPGSIQPGVNALFNDP
jgi:hypothetical protein